MDAEANAADCKAEVEDAELQERLIGDSSRGERGSAAGVRTAAEMAVEAEGAMLEGSAAASVAGAVIRDEGGAIGPLRVLQAEAALARVDASRAPTTGLAPLDDGPSERDPSAHLTPVLGSVERVDLVPSRGGRPAGASYRPVPTLRQQAAQLAAARAAATEVARRSGWASRGSEGGGACVTSGRSPSRRAACGTSKSGGGSSRNGAKMPPWRATPTMGAGAWADGAERSSEFRQTFCAGVPLVVKGVHARLKRDWSAAGLAKIHGHRQVAITDAANDTPFGTVSLSDFLEGFTNPTHVPTAAIATGKKATSPSRLGGSREAHSTSPANVSGGATRRRALKLRDWPHDDSFREVLPHHYVDLQAALPIGAYTRADGHFNLASYHDPSLAAPDLGPKLYCAYGAWNPELFDRDEAAASYAMDDSDVAKAALDNGVRGGTTRLHCDMSDAINLLVHVASDSGAAEVEGDARAHMLSDCEIGGQEILPSHGAVWHIFSAEDTETLRRILPTLLPAGTIMPSSFLLDSSVYLNAHILYQLEVDAGIRPYVVLQEVGDALIIPAGCAHQVANIRSCVKVATDFVSPDHIPHVSRLAAERRLLPATHGRKTDVLGFETLLFNAASLAVHTLGEECGLPSRK
uniref:JmjC domain-containing protein n=1 Tax=Strombidinopsis acuminata TaxID=141414 RepID=A0A7S3RGU3_9SPIT